MEAEDDTTASVTEHSHETTERSHGYGAQNPRFPHLERFLEHIRRLNNGIPLMIEGIRRRLTPIYDSRNPGMDSGINPISPALPAAMPLVEVDPPIPARIAGLNQRPRYCPRGLDALILVLGASFSAITVGSLIYVVRVPGSWTAVSLLCIGLAGLIVIITVQAVRETSQNTEARLHQLEDARIRRF